MLSHEESEAWSVAMELQNQPDAEEQLSNAIQTAQQDGNTVLEGEARTALGIYYQHKGRMDEARLFLEHAISVMDEGLADYAVGRQHLDALNSGLDCGCHNNGAKVAKFIEEYVLSRLPEGMVSHFGVTVKNDGKVNLDLEVTREISNEEEQLVNDTIDEALRISSPA
tara:strand:+ start:4793 stop:5296 length:504 start_codon:yes stop_codon:yes gene_type:complete